MCHTSCSSRINFDIKKLRLLLFRRVLISDSPPREFDRIAKLLTCLNIVKLNYSSVYIVCKVAAHVADLLDGIPDLVCSLTLKILFYSGDAVLTKELITLAMRFKCLSSCFLHIEDKQRKPSFLSNVSFAS